jgi:hypothetical protein
MHGRRRGTRRPRLILAEFVLAALDMPLLGPAHVRVAAAVPQVLPGAYLIGVGLNCLPLALHAISQYEPTGSTPNSPARTPGQNCGDIPPNSCSARSRCWC